MRRSSIPVAFAVALALSLSAALAADKSPEDVLKEKGLTKVGTTYLLEGDVKLGEELRKLRMAKKTLDEDTRKRVQLETQIKRAKGALSQWEFEYRTLNEKLAGVKDNVFENNKIVGQLNALTSKIKEGTQVKSDWEAELRKTNESRDAYVVAVLEVSDKLEALQKQYDAINADPDVKAVVGTAKPPKVKIGPSTEMAQNLTLVRKQRETINSAVVKVTIEGRVPHVDVTFNGKVTRSLVLDSGASLVCLTAETAKALNMNPGPNDPVIRLTLADGKVVEAKQMMIKSVRVGQFIVENVECAVLPESLVAADNLLGGTFLSNFVYKLDHEAGELHMSQIGKAGAKPVAAPGAGAGAAPMEK